MCSLQVSLVVSRPALRPGSDMTVTGHRPHPLTEDGSQSSHASATSAIAAVDHQVQSAPMSIEVEAVQQVTDELVEACRRLLPS